MSTNNYFTVPSIEDDLYPDNELPKPCGAKLTPAETDAVFNAEHPDIRMSFDPAVHARQWNAEAYANRLAPIDGIYSTFVYREAKSTTDLVQSEARRRQFIENWWLSRQRAKNTKVSVLAKIYSVILGVAVIGLVIAFGWFYGKGIPH